jgi:prepilin-type N-terminal cleavage/methylation domain-containing protein
MKKRLKNIINNRGFSMLEILIASAISGMILVMVSTSYRNVLQAITSVSGYAEFYENINLAINKIDTDISNTFFDRYNKKTTFIGDLNGENSTLNFITTKYSNFHISGRLNKESPHSDTNEVGYYLKEDNEHPGLFFLIRREQLLYDDEPNSGGTESILLVNVVNLKFEYNNW